MRSDGTKWFCQTFFLYVYLLKVTVELYISITIAFKELFYPYLLFFRQSVLSVEVAIVSAVIAEE